jgi:protocatechuate 3,4-dioxygenase beta subunit
MVFSKEMEIGVQNRIYFPNDETITGTPVLIQIKDSNGTIIYKDRMMK